MTERWESVSFSELKGKILSNIERIDDEEIRFTTKEGTIYKMYHDQDCCEEVCIKDIVGDFKDIIGETILSATEEISEQYQDKDSGWHDYIQWTFYKLATFKGYVDIAWMGESNGYYTMTATFKKLVRTE